MYLYFQLEPFNVLTGAMMGVLSDGGGALSVPLLLWTLTDGERD